MVVTDGKGNDVGEGDDDIHGNDWCGQGDDDDDNDEAKNVLVLAWGTKRTRLQGNSLIRRKINTPGR